MSFLGPLEAGADLVLGFLDAGPGRALDRLPGLQVLVDGEEVLDLEQQILADVLDVPQMIATMIGAGTQSTLSSPPASSFIRNMAIARHRIRHPGKVGSDTSTRASSGSPSWPRVPSMKP